MERIATRSLPLVLIAVLCYPVAAQQSYIEQTRPSPVSMTAISKQIRDLEYHFSMREDGSWTAPNRGNNLRSVVHSEGLEVVSRTEGAGGFRVGLRLVGHGREGALEPALPVQPQGRKERVELMRPGLTEWFVNRVDGLEHGFTIEWRPDGDAAGPLVIEMALDTNLALRLTDEGRSVEFREGGGLAVLRYANLAVYDARHATVPANLSLRPGRLRIVIDDSTVAYPLTVDPLLTVPAWTYESDQVNAYFGWSVGGAGDVNGDGIDDVIVGADFFDNGELQEGKVFVFHGSPAGLSAEPDWTQEGNQDFAEMGNSVAGAGDVNGDGFDDVVIGAAGFDNVEVDEGAIWVYLGSETGLESEAHLHIEGHELLSNVGAPGKLGASVQTAGDVDGDGFDEIIVSHRNFENVELNEGAAYVFMGSESGLATTPDWSYETNQPNASVSSVGTAGDVNGDGYDDIVVGSALYGNGQTWEGRVLVFYGSPTGLPVPAVPDFTYESDVVDARLGAKCVFTAGDVNADGYDDIIVGAFLYSNSEIKEGAAFVWHGSASGIQGEPDWTFESNQEDAQAGYCVSTVGDVNGDGYDDVIVGAWFYNVLFQKEGRAWVFYGSTSGLSPPNLPDWSVSGLQEEARLGRHVARTGDVNGDGYDDVIVPAAYYDNPEDDEGRVRVYHGFCDGDDLDGDLRCDGLLDCDDTDPTIWATPGEVVDVAFVSKTMLTWAEPPEPGATSVRYDTLRSADATDFSAATCIDTNGADTGTVDADEPAEGSVYFYLVRAESDCPTGDGSLGTTADGVERVGPACPTP